MDAQFWFDRWREGKIGFHEGKPNDLLEKHAAHLGQRRRVLVPLCGKAVDLAYLASQGHDVIGVELVEDAAKQFFDGASPEVIEHAAHRSYTHSGVTIFVGDFFATTPALLGPLDALYDRAALIALPPDLRPTYVDHVRDLVAAGSPGIVISLEYDETRMSGPPFSVTLDEVRAHYPTAVELEARVVEHQRLKDQGADAIERCFAITL